MHAIHLHDIHLPKGPNLFLLSLGLVVCFSMALLFFLISWGSGGDVYMDLLGGDVTFVLLLGGLLVSVVFAFFEKREQ